MSKTPSFTTLSSTVKKQFETRINKILETRNSSIDECDAKKQMLLDIASEISNTPLVQATGGLTSEQKDDLYEKIREAKIKIYSKFLETIKHATIFDTTQTGDRIKYNHDITKYVDDLFDKKSIETINSIGVYKDYGKFTKSSKDPAKIGRDGDHYVALEFENDNVWLPLFYTNGDSWGFNKYKMGSNGVSEFLYTTTNPQNNTGGKKTRHKLKTKRSFQKITKSRRRNNRRQ
jgi:hypothetical protein